ncbi:putative sodium channel and clathrin linker 1 isoform X2 [Apostichopus japonicus]|uniref:Putative sodium channel and clathrin linker 1 isoform X2 n=1 Tax=Stichopus japonicus TaxID=307972 RepID=A0A2G8LLT0_STIJA|nr:putative sodium channel and clathrin linker 1 isoform X2 [Apostichopus japonicus]
MPDLSTCYAKMRRLNAALSVYQEKYPPLSDEEQSELNKRSNYLPQLLTDQSILTPLILEYDSENRALRQQVNTYRVETEGLRTKVEKLAKENERLQTELKVTVEGQLEAMGWSGEINSSNDHLISQLQKQVSSLQEEKEAALDLWRTSSQQYEDINTKFREIRLTEQAEKLSQQALEDKAEQLLRKNGELMTTKQKLERANQHLQEIYNTHSKELADTREQLKITRTDKRTAEVKLAEMDHGKSLLEEKLYMKIKRADTFKRDSESTRSELKEVSLSLITLQEETGQISSENEALREARVELEQKVKSLHWKCAEADRREFEAVNQVRESIQMVENSLLEKDEALIREKQKVVEIERLQQVMENLLNEAGKRTRQEVDTVRKQCNMNIAKLMDEIQALENETGQKQAEIERLLREKRAVEEELENLTSLLRHETKDANSLIYDVP